MDVNFLFLCNFVVLRLLNIMYVMMYIKVKIKKYYVYIVYVGIIICLF